MAVKSPAPNSVTSSSLMISYENFMAGKCSQCRPALVMFPVKQKTLRGFKDYSQYMK